MHIDKYVVNNIGTKWTNGKSKKNSLLASLDGTDGIDLRKLVPLLEQWHETDICRAPARLICRSSADIFEFRLLWFNKLQELMKLQP